MYIVLFSKLTHDNNRHPAYEVSDDNQGHIPGQGYLLGVQRVALGFRQLPGIADYAPVHVQVPSRYKHERHHVYL